jgi:dihydroxyacetone kinase-like protein
VARRVNDRARSFGVALSSCTPPAAGSPIFEIFPGEIELGVGIHGEPGRKRAQLGTAAEVAEQMAQPILDDLGLESGGEVLAFVNGLGGTPAIELYLLYGELSKLLAERGIAVRRNLVGSYITSLEMAGASFTLLELDKELEQLWDAAVHTPALRWGV